MNAPAHRLANCSILVGALRGSRTGRAVIGALASLAIATVAQAQQQYVSRIFIYDGVQTTQILNSSDFILNVGVAGGRVVWQSQEGSTSHVYLFEAGQTTKLTDDLTGGFGPLVSESHVLWRRVVNSSVELVLDDGSQAAPIANGAIGTFDVGLDGGRVVWLDGNIFTHQAGQTTQLTNAAPDFHLSEPTIGGGRIAWVGQQLGTDSEIYVYDGVSSAPLTNNSVIDLFPQVSDSLVAWRQQSDPNGELMLNDGAQTAPISSYGPSTNQRDLHGDRLVWSEHDGQQYDVYLYDSGVITRLTNTSAPDVSPAVSDVWTAWQVLDPNDFSVTIATHAFNGTAIVDLPVTPHFNAPLASNSFVVTWESYRVPEPPGLTLLLVTFASPAFRQRPGAPASAGEPPAA
jgi:hypothetical protein